MRNHKREAQESKRATVNLWPEAGRILGLGRNSVYKGAASGEMPTIKVGKRLLVPRKALDRLLEGVGK